MPDYAAFFTVHAVFITNSCWAYVQYVCNVIICSASILLCSTWPGSALGSSLQRIFSCNASGTIHTHTPRIITPVMCRTTTHTYARIIGSRAHVEQVLIASHTQHFPRECSSPCASPLPSQKEAKRASKWKVCSRYPLSYFSPFVWGSSRASLGEHLLFAPSLHTCWLVYTKAWLKFITHY